MCTGYICVGTSFGFVPILSMAIMWTLANSLLVLGLWRDVLIWYRLNQIILVFATFLLLMSVTYFRGNFFYLMV